MLHLKLLVGYLFELVCIKFVMELMQSTANFISGKQQNYFFYISALSKEAHGLGHDYVQLLIIGTSQC